MDIIDKKILNIIQKNFPLDAEPFKAVAEKIGISEEEALDRIRRMKQDGIIRRDRGGLRFPEARFRQQAVRCKGAGRKIKGLC